MIACWLLYNCHELWGTRLKQIGMRRLLDNENNVSDIWRGHSHIDNKSLLLYLAHSHDFLNRLLWEILTSLSTIFDSGLVMQQKISQCNSVENNSLHWFSSWWWISSLVIHEKRKCQSDPIRSRVQWDPQSNPIRAIRSGLYVDGQPFGLSWWAAASCRDSFLFHSRRLWKQLGFSHSHSL